MWKVPSECPGLDCRWRRSSWGWRMSSGGWRRSSWGWRRSSHCMAQVQRFAGAGHPIALVLPLSTGAGLQGDGAGPEVSWRRSVFIDGTCAANVASVLSNGAGPHHFFGPAPGCLGTCAGQLGDLRRTGEGAFGCRGCLTLRPSFLCTSASLRSAVLSVPPLCAPLLPSALLSRRPSALRHAGEGGNADADFGAEGFEEGFCAGRQGGAGGVDVIDQEDVAGEVVESGRAVKSGGVVEA